jgi:cobalt-zinc-cadmium efflux system membrane fusion protein
MKPGIARISLSISSFLILLFLGACQNRHSDGDGHDHGSGSSSQEHDHGDESPNTASLTEEQIKTVGLILGTPEQKNLTATIKANGILKVPNKNKANVTSLYGGVVKTLKVELGDYVRKGQVIATIENPQFILLQEEYRRAGITASAGAGLG